MIEHGELERIILSHEADKLAERAIDIGEALYGADGALAVGDRQESAALQEELERLHGPSDIAPSGDKPESTLDSFKEKTAAFAEKYKALPFNEKISVLATTFGCRSGTIKTSPCTGDWRGTSDVSLVFDNGNSYFLGNGLTPKVKTKNRQNEMLNTALELYNPETIELSKETALAALKQREVLDNMAGAKMGLKPYTVLNVEMRDASVPVHDIGSDHVGWYFVTLAIDGKIRAHLETNLSYGVKSGTTSTVPEREKYFPAGALHENDVDYLFNGVGFSSSSSLYTLQLTEKERMRAEKTLKEIRPEVDVQDEKEAGGLESFIAQYNAEHGGKENPENSRQEDIDR